MKEISQWWNENLFTNCFTFITVIVSGLISWIVSAIYFYLGNRNNLKMSFIYPVMCIIDKPCSGENYQELAMLKDSYVLRYLSPKEMEAWKELVDRYFDVKDYTKSTSQMQCIISYFEYELKKNNIDLLQVPVEDDGIVMYYETPFSMREMEDNIKRQIDFECDMDDELIEQFDLENKISEVLEYYTKTFYSDKIFFF